MSNSFLDKMSRSGTMVRMPDAVLATGISVQPPSIIDREGGMHKRAACWGGLAGGRGRWLLCATRNSHKPDERLEVTGHLPGFSFVHRYERYHHNWPRRLRPGIKCKQLAATVASDSEEPWQILTHLIGPV